MTIPPVQLGGWDGKQKQGVSALEADLDSLRWKTEVSCTLTRAGSLRVGQCIARPLQPAALAFVSYGFVLVRVRVQGGFDPNNFNFD